MFVLTVEIDVHHGMMDAFLPLMKTNARASVESEPGCRQFDICRERDMPDRIFLYEVYDDEAAFQAHKDTPHYQSFDATAGPMMARKSARVFERLAP